MFITLCNIMLWPLYILYVTFQGLISIILIPPCHCLGWDRWLFDNLPVLVLPIRCNQVVCIQPCPVQKKAAVVGSKEDIYISYSMKLPTLFFNTWNGSNCENLPHRQNILCLSQFPLGPRIHTTNSPLPLHVVNSVSFKPSTVFKTVKSGNKNCHKCTLVADVSSWSSARRQVLGFARI